MEKTTVEKMKDLKNRISSYIKENGGLKDSDEEIINLYVETHEFYQRMRKDLLKSELLMEHTNKAGATNIVKNPLAIEITKTVQTLNNLLKSMGLTPAQRKSVETPAGDDEFEDF